MRHFEFEAMGTTVEAWIGTGAGASPIQAWFEEVEHVCSRFRNDSELSRINRSNAAKHTVSPLLAEVLSAADRARRLTEGLVDAGLGGLVNSWGYDRTFAEVSELLEPPSTLPEVGWVLDRRGQLVRSPGTLLDLGGIAKGWTCDRAVDMGLAQVASAGGDLRSSHPDTMVSILDGNDETVARVEVGVGAVATSSTARRRWTVGNQRVNHLMDPRSMAPVVTPIVTASVVAATAVEAEAGAKAVLLLGVDGLAWADEQDWIDAALVVWNDGSVFATRGLQVAA